MAVLIVGGYVLSDDHVNRASGALYCLDDIRPATVARGTKTPVDFAPMGPEALVGVKVGSRKKCRRSTADLIGF